MFHLQTGFEFKKRRAFPVLTGIVIAAENESALLEVRIPRARCGPNVSGLTRSCVHIKAYWEAEQEADAKRRAKRQEQVIKRWTKLVQGLRIRQRLVEQYADRAPPDAQAQLDVASEKQTAEEVRVFSVLYPARFLCRSCRHWHAPVSFHSVCRMTGRCGPWSRTCR